MNVISLIYYINFVLVVIRVLW